MKKEKVLISGGTGLIGSALAVRLIDAGCEVWILTRNKAEAIKKNKLSGLQFAEWNAEQGFIEAEAIKDTTIIINLAGAGVVDKPWSNAYKNLIVSSRVNSGETIAKALSNTQNSVTTVINASAIGYYGADRTGKKAFAETDPADSSFLGVACKKWEQSIEPVKALQKKLVVLRFGIVLSTKGGALQEFLKPLKLRVASVLGNGTQMVSWIHIDDLCSMIIYAIENRNVDGIYNAVAPAPVTNKALTVSLAKTLYGKGFITAHVPQFVLKILMGERSIEVLKSATVSSEKIEKAGFKFRFGNIDEAIKNLLGK
jgi:uncharacterized protein (TIGR01777 family)